MRTIRIHIIGRNFSVLVYGQYVTYLYDILQMFPDFHRILPLFGMLKIDLLVILFPDRNFVPAPQNKIAAMELLSGLLPDILQTDS